MQTSSEVLGCCLCDNARSEAWKQIDQFELQKCQSCGLVHLSQVIVSPEAFLGEAPVTMGLEYWGYPVVYQKHRRVFDHFFEERFQRIIGKKPPPGTWLDVGSGFGLWQSFVQDRKISVKGIELEAGAQAFCKGQGLEVMHSSIEAFETKERFSVITMCDVLEHVKDPIGILAKCRELLLPGGLLYLQVPSVLGFRYPYNDSLGLPHHLWQFTPSHLLKAIGQSGLKTVDWWTGVQGVIRHYEQGGPSLMTKLLWKLAMISRRGNRLQVLARRL